MRPLYFWRLRRLRRRPASKAEARLTARGEPAADLEPVYGARDRRFLLALGIDPGAEIGVGVAPKQEGP